MKGVVLVPVRLFARRERCSVRLLILVLLTEPAKYRIISARFLWLTMFNLRSPMTTARGISAATQSLKKCPVDKVFELLTCLYRTVSAWATVMCQNVSNRRAEKDMAFVILVMLSYQRCASSCNVELFAVIG